MTCACSGRGGICVLPCDSTLPDCCMAPSARLPPCPVRLGTLHKGCRCFWTFKFLLRRKDGGFFFSCITRNLKSNDTVFVLFCEP